jgi:23S rRNA (uracil1939-C5)-methyltransferase
MEVRIEKLVYGGDGLAHQDGQTVFVPLVLPGELVRIEAATRKKKFVRGRLKEIIEPSAERVAAPCNYFGTCGGCNYQHMPYEVQMRYKSDILRETLGRIGRVKWDGPIETIASPAFGYRNRTQWKVRAKNAAASEVAGIGYFEAGSTRLCPVDYCPILSPLLEESLKTLSALVEANPLFRAIDEIEAFADGEDKHFLLNVSSARLTEPPEAIAAALRSALPQIESILIQDRHADKLELIGPGYLTYAAHGTNYRVGHLSFFQVNRFLLDSMIEKVTGDVNGRLALDLYAGVGLFTIPLTKLFTRVVGVESNLAAARDLEANLQACEGPAAVHRHATAENFLANWHERPDLVVMDPPRAGVEPATLARLGKIAPWKIHYLSCDPATLARDLAILTGSEEKPGDYKIANIYLFDIFPQTYHMEVLVRLARRT